MTREFWKSSGFHLVERNADGWLDATPDLIRAYLTRPEVHPVDESCAAEVETFEALMADPFLEITDERLATFEDSDAADNYRVVLGFRDCLKQSGTLEAAYLALMRGGEIRVPPVFIDQIVHIMLRGMLSDVDDPVRLRTAELFFREQTVNTDDGRIILADQEIVEMHSGTAGLGTIGQLLTETGTPIKQIELDVLDDDNASIYWARSDRFDTVVDMRFGHPANHALARVIETWIRHFLGVDVRVQPLRSIKDEQWRWHIGLDRDATELLNALYEGRDISEADQARILALYRLEILDQARVLPDVKGKPVYLALGSTPDKRVRMKPQNLLMNLPLRAADS
ncbi:MAG: DUF6352 family protein [Hyphomicrobiaceae bacterium]